MAVARMSTLQLYLHNMMPLNTVARMGRKSEGPLLPEDLLAANDCKGSGSCFASMV